MSSLLIIGGSGFFGKSLLDSYLRGLLNPWGINRIHVLSRTASKLKNLNPELSDSSINLIDENIATCNVVPYSDYVIHAAASSIKENYLYQPEREKQNILAAVFNYCDLAPKFHAKSKIVFCSSGAVYGMQPAKLDFISEEFPLQAIESLPIHKRDYAQAKRDAEQAIAQLSKLKLNVSIARCFTFFGKYLPRDQHFAIGNFINDCIYKRDINIESNHLVFRTYMYADDLVEALITIADKSSINPQIFNVGSDEVIEIHELGKSLASKFGLRVTESNLDFSVDKIDRYVPSVKKMKSILNLKPKYSLESGFNEIFKFVYNEQKF